jgi:hypothetical protein
MLDATEIERAIESGNAEFIAALIKEQNLEIKDGKIVADPAMVKESFEFWDQRQLIKKILLNS